MKKELIRTLTDNFEIHAQQTENGIEYWLARDLQHLLGYDQWRNFAQVISKPKVACEVSGHEVLDHFADVSKMVDLGSGVKREIDDVVLTRYACYLIAQMVIQGKSRLPSLRAILPCKPAELSELSSAFWSKSAFLPVKSLPKQKKICPKSFMNKRGKTAILELFAAKGIKPYLAKPPSR